MWANNKSCCKGRGVVKEYKERFKGEEKSAGIDFCMLASHKDTLIESFFKCGSLAICEKGKRLLRFELF